MRLLPPYYKYIKTKYWTDYYHYWNTLFDIGGKLLTEERLRLQELADADKTDNTPEDLRRTEEMEFLPYILARGELTDEQITGNIVEIMAAGVDSVIIFLIIAVFKKLSVNIILLLFKIKVNTYVLFAII